MDKETIVLGGGCFWCTEAVYSALAGVVSATPGYSGGQSLNPTYEQVCQGITGHAEVVQVVYEPDRISFEEILRIFFASHDPTTLNSQGNDIGTQYRSVIFFTTTQQQKKANHYINVLNKSEHTKSIVTTVEPLAVFYPAEEYHKDYFKLNTTAPYCQLVIAPKVSALKKKFPTLLK